ncbi:hypothetical protein TorRG33x02_150280 [Trema orientale]|uniref:Uncharacterized protein n=1 Tax=Trema orientale TaxID=63057 RepID=A0A2P5EUH0_TREOI|nr:hypothetical protein TorRG33x02_150280 [Trema orientale]
MSWPKAAVTADGEWDMSKLIFVQFGGGGSQPRSLSMDGSVEIKLSLNSQNEELMDFDMAMVLSQSAIEEICEGSGVRFQEEENQSLLAWSQNRKIWVAVSGDELQKGHATKSMLRNVAR